MSEEKIENQEEQEETVEEAEAVEKETVKEPETAEEEIVVEPETEEAEKKQPTPDMKKTRRNVVDISDWKPRTEIGRKVKNGEITDLATILDSGRPILESEIVDFLIPNLDTDLLLIGQSRGKFGGGQRRVFKQTQKKTREGNKPQFATFAVVGNKNGYVGVGYGKAKETVPAREKAIRNAKLNLIKIRRGCGSWECECGNPHTVPFDVKGKSGSVEIKLMSAPIGKGLVIESECQKIMALAGIKDVWSKTQGKTKTKNNLIIACYRALLNLMQTKITADQMKHAKILEGQLNE